MCVWGTNRAILTIDYNPIQTLVPNPESTIIALLGIGLTRLAGGASRRKLKKKTPDNS